MDTKLAKFVILIIFKLTHKIILLRLINLNINLSLYAFENLFISLNHMV